MKQSFFEIISNIQLTDSVYKMILIGDTDSITSPGQFVNIKLNEKYLRRPISVCDCNENTLTLVYKVVGNGTKQMSLMKAKEKLDILTGLGNGYDTACSGEHPLLIGGGVGIPPLYMLAKQLVKEGKKPQVILGFNTASEAFFESDFYDIGNVTVCSVTVDGSNGNQGFVTDVMHCFDYTYFYTCGPEPMLKAVYAKSTTDGQFSFEERMGCGFGACMGCSCQTITGYKRICKDGPVLKKEEIKWA